MDRWHSGRRLQAYRCNCHAGRRPRRVPSHHSKCRPTPPRPPKSPSWSFRGRSSTNWALFSGLCFQPEGYLEAIVDPRHAHFLPRSAAENDPSFKQIIPYAILTHAGRILHYVRGKKTGAIRN